MEKIIFFGVEPCLRLLVQRKSYVLLMEVCVNCWQQIEVLNNGNNLMIWFPLGSWMFVLSRKIVTGGIYANTTRELLVDLEERFSQVNVGSKSIFKKNVTDCMATHQATNFICLTNNLIMPLQKPQSIKPSFIAQLWGRMHHLFHHHSIFSFYTRTMQQLLSLIL